MLKRDITPIIIQSMEHFPAVLIQGARQVGKSTVLEKLKREGYLQDTISLDDLSTLQAAKRDPQGFIKSLPERTGLDEIQRCPELVLALKEKMDQVKKPGQYVLTGSANIYPSQSKFRCRIAIPFTV
jgi:predicted AAA+ superfamily ATPase